MIYIFLPAYNEEVALNNLVRKFELELKKIKEPYRLVVLDDGSQDRTAAVAEGLSKDYPLTLLRHPLNQGLGRTIVDGFEYVAHNASAGDFLITMDCDDTHDPMYIHPAIAKIKEGFDLVILSR